MSKFLLKSLLVSPMVLGATLAFSNPAVSNEALQAQAINSEAQAAVPALPTAEPPAVQSSIEFGQKLAQAMPAASESTDVNALDQINRYTREGRANRLGQVTSVSQLSDVRPTDWAFQALQSLVERYGCIVGYPDRTYRGNRAMTRYEFAAGLNACLDKIQELIAAATADFVKKEDLEVVKKLQEEFAAELATLRGRVDALEVRTATLEKQQFSTTTKLSGEVIFAVTDEFAQPGNNETVFQNRVRLLLSSSFSGKDKLVVRLDAGNANRFNAFDLAGNNQGGLLDGLQTFNSNADGGNRVVIGWIGYYFPVGENIQVYVPAFAGLHYDLLPTHAGPMEDFDGGNGSLSYFAQRNPIYNIGGGAGAAVGFGVGKPISLYVSYMSDTANSPLSGQGLFDGGYSALAQLSFTTDKFSVGLTGVHAFRKGATFDLGGGVGSTAFVGTQFSNLAPSGFKANGVVVNGGGVSAAFKLTEKIVLNGWVSYFSADSLGDGIGDSDIWTYALGISFPDFGKPGNLLGLFAGAPPYSKDNLGGLSNVRSTPIHVEGFYRFRLNDNISVTPGVIWVINANQDDRKDALIGTLRTTFTF
jgi:hypothetical protein